MLGVVTDHYTEKMGKIVSTIPSLVNLGDSKTQTIVDTVKQCLVYFGIDLHRMVGIGTDASVVAGVNNGVYQKLKMEVPKPLVRSMCHSLHLAISSAMAEALLRHLEYLESEICNWFCQSPSRQLCYHNLYRRLNDGHYQLKIVQPCSTRWLSIQQSEQCRTNAKN
ncbi:hypothetical protein HPB50_020835 [Hyalomma asiaticum]|uniref:Uncharacterized protein n=1 Tax=Hyalomma asiaticum TaxID=266040 RepID=A0ACB7RXW7_HYAAI|nr:hypothetical protein HPB50_020835 [Hyalomma asiaticum]